MIWPWIVFGVVVAYLIVDFTVIRPRLIRRVEAARAANGGRHTIWWWVSVGLIFAIAVALLVAQLA